MTLLYIIIALLSILYWAKKEIRNYTNDENKIFDNLLIKITNDIIYYRKKDYWN